MKDKLEIIEMIEDLPMSHKSLIYTSLEEVVLEINKDVKTSIECETKYLDKLKNLATPYISSEIDTNKIIEDLLCKIFQLGSAKDKAMATIWVSQHFSHNR